MKFAAGIVVGMTALTAATVGWLLRKLNVDLAGMRIP